MGLLPSDEELEKADYLYDQRREERADEQQAELFSKPLPADVFTLLRLFTNYRGIDEPQSYPDLHQHYHGAFDDPNSREVWGKCRLSRTIDVAFERGLITYRKKWEITDKGLAARKAETVRRMRG
jgi:hypothetical protein